MILGGITVVSLVVSILFLQVVVLTRFLGTAKPGHRQSHENRTGTSLVCIVEDSLKEGTPTEEAIVKTLRFSKSPEKKSEV
jgi:hypothetical protein